MSDIERRKAANEAVFRNVNERIEALQHSFAVAEKEPLQMICEFDQLDCMELVTICVDAYVLIRSQLDQFIVTVYIFAADHRGGADGRQVLRVPVARR